VDWDAAAWQEFDQLVLSLESQYAEVAEALKVLNGHVVIPRQFTPAEPVLDHDPIDRMISQQEPRSGTRVEDALELIDVSPEPTDSTSRRGVRSLGN
jgi:hypothetical protein